MKSILRAVLPCLTTLSVVTNSASAEDWAASTPGNWNDPANWSPQSVPNGVSASATILSTVEGGVLNTPGTITFDVPVTLGSFYADMGFAGPSLYFNGNTLTLDNGGGADVTMFTDASLALNFTNDIVLMGHLVTEWRASNGAITGNISGNYGITQDAIGGIPRIRLLGNNTYTGETIARNGWVAFESMNGLGDHATGTIVEAGGTLLMEALGNPTIIGEPVTIMDGGRLILRECDWAQEVLLVNNARIAPWFDDYEVTFSGKLTGSATFTRLSAQSASGDQQQESILYLTNVNNDYTDGTILDGGLLAVADDAVLGAAGASITFDSVGFNEGSTALLTTADITINRDIIMIDPGWLRAEAGTTGSYANVISGGQPLDIGYLNWTGAVELLADNTYTGDTTVIAGTLLVNNTTGSATGSGNVTVLDGATLAGNGAMAGSATAQTNSTIAPGNTGSTSARGTSIGAINVGGLSLLAGSTYECELAGHSAFDQLVVSGAATLAGSLDVSLVDSYSPADGLSYDIIIATSVAGTFDNESLPAGFSVEYLADAVRLHYDAPSCPSDIADSKGATPDGMINLFDLLLLLDNWGTGGAGAAISADGGGDTVVDLFDLLAMLDAWGDC